MNLPTKSQRKALQRILQGKLGFLNIDLARRLARKGWLEIPEGDRVDPSTVVVTPAGVRAANLQKIHDQAAE